MKIHHLLSIFCLASLYGCGAGGDFSDLQSYMDEVRNRPCLLYTSDAADE